MRAETKIVSNKKADIYMTDSNYIMQRVYNIFRNLLSLAVLIVVIGFGYANSKNILELRERTLSTYIEAGSQICFVIITVIIVLIVRQLIFKAYDTSMYDSLCQDGFFNITVEKSKRENERKITVYYKDDGIIAYEEFVCKPGVDENEYIDKDKAFRFIIKTKKGERTE